LDVADEAAVHGFAEAVRAAHDTADILINNAGVAIYGSVMEVSTAELRWLMDINFYGVVFGVRAFLPMLLERPDASIVNVSSLFGLWAPAGQSAYSAAKFAVRGYSESLRGELSRASSGRRNRDCAHVPRCCCRRSPGRRKIVAYVR
jgi:NAD(P)-dependent dehydrogenase (short-subunit alcohol dehydrogenase family)